VIRAARRVARIGKVEGKMPVKALDHYNIRTTRLVETINFYADVLGMQPTLPPGSKNFDMSAWICDATGRAIVHVNHADTNYPPPARLHPSEIDDRHTGRVDHIAFESENYPAMLENLKAREVPYVTSEIAKIRLRQIFVHDPNGVLLELNFREAA
jgi:catechol 2,3-dioxygenase-like lactoylglutathione lyase family enzyme